MSRREVEPHIDLIPEGFPDQPDWDRFGIRPPNAFKPVGDPTRWGAEVATAIDVSMVRFSEQVLAISTRDGYARSWSLCGNLALPIVTWGSLDMAVWLECTQGVGQVKLVQNIMLYGADAVAPRGLCITQGSGAPYYDTLAVLPPQPLDVRSFAAIGALIGQSISIRVGYATANALLTLGMPATPRISLIVAPYAAGEGL